MVIAVAEQRSMQAVRERIALSFFSLSLILYNTDLYHNYFTAQLLQNEHTSIKQHFIFVYIHSGQ
jgi:hypothetical protein